ncbi:MAG: D-alanine--D-alanine ligase family protein [Bacteroidota bacterium]|nr:D-alanine--D-alanine ligase family protein [Bacteroidota bacterium]
MKRKLKIGVLFGGRSAEHEVSLVSATSVINALDKKKYDVVPIGITLNGRWISSPDALEVLKSRKKINQQPQKILLPDPNLQGIVEIFSKINSKEKIDVIFPVLHGTFGEDGTVQGLLELANIPYVGAGVLASSVAMDKIVARRLYKAAGIPVTPDVWFLRKEFQVNKKFYLSQVANELGFPCFVKPANMGSSVGITKAHNRRELEGAIELAAYYDRKILVEKSVQNAREIEVSLLGNDNPIVSVPGEIIPSNEFYDYDAKYVDGKSTSEIPVNIPKRVSDKIKEYALRGYKAIDCSGMARADFLVERNSNKIYLSELNTIPGFTSISMYPKLWEASGIPYPKLLDMLIKVAIEKFEEKSKLKTAYRPKKDWYKN